MNRTQLLDQAKAETANRKEYAPPAVNYERIARLWNAHLANVGATVVLSSIDVILMMDLVKTSRLEETNAHIDSWVDKAGYSALGVEIATEGQADVTGE